MRVGLIGATVTRGWAMAAHIPALKGLAGFELAAIATSRRETADAAAKAYGVPLAFDDYHEMVNHPDLDIITVSVKVPMHFDMVTAALNAGKHVYCEWPLGRDSVQAERMAALARKKGLRCIVGLQSRGSPVVNRVKDLVADGYVGRVLGTTMVTTAPTWGGTTDAASAYLYNYSNGATLLSIPGGHSLDALCYCLGEFSQISATVKTQRKEALISTTGKRVGMTAPDQVALSGVLKGGAVVSFHARGGMTRGTPFLWEIHGDKGDLAVTGDATIQYAELKLRGGQEGEPLADLPIPDSYRRVPKGIPAMRPYNVAQLYVELGEAIRAGRNPSPGFYEAVVRHHMLEVIRKSSDTGERQQP
ncbi:MAG: Gfo/Idh/MocA family oxidoreductase [Betaproteobacteria bacterium]|nr:Gfo/Idh/MocA family oxidoreductase [Betaproteobacteria bacterium]